jgi:hypothetical protein
LNAIVEAQSKVCFFTTGSALNKKLIEQEFLNGLYFKEVTKGFFSVETLNVLIDFVSINKIC